MTLPTHFLHSFLEKHRKKVLIFQMALLVLTLGFGSYRFIVSAHGGDEGLIHSCLSPAGLIRIIDPETSCLTGEDALDWDGSSTERFQTTGGGLDPIYPVATWIDVSGGDITETFGEGQWKVSYTGMLKLSGGNGTAYVRVQLRQDGEDPIDIGQQTIYRFQSPLPTTEASTMPFHIEELIEMPAGEVTLVPQVYGPGEWSLFGNSKMILEK